MVKAIGLTKYYGKRPGVEAVDFTIREHEIVGLLGPNGAGKSTIMKMLAGYQLPTAGTIEIDGRDIQEIMDKNLMCTGFLPENPPLYPEMEVEELLLFAASVRGIKKKERLPHVQKIMELTNITHVKDRLVKNLSKGYRQRAGMAQALIGLPPVIILDEPTVGMDPAQIQEVRLLLKDLKKEHTVIISSHILAEIGQVCDRVLVIHQGKLILEESMERLKNGQSNGFLLRTTADLDTVTACLRYFPDIGEVTELSPGVYMAAAGDSDILRSQAVTALVQAGIPVIEMKKAGHTLEEIFLKLTGGT